MIPGPTDNTTTDDIGPHVVDPWACLAVTDGVRCTDPGTDAHFCPYHAPRWRA